MTTKQFTSFATTDANGNASIAFTSIGGNSSIGGVSISAPGSLTGGGAIVYIGGVVQGISFWAKSDTAASPTPTVVGAGDTLTVEASGLSPNVQFGLVINYDFTVT